MTNRDDLIRRHDAIVECMASEKRPSGGVGARDWLEIRNAIRELPSVSLPPLPDDVAEMITTLKTPYDQSQSRRAAEEKKAADMLERQQQRITELEAENKRLYSQDQIETAFYRTGYEPTAEELLETLREGK